MQQEEGMNESNEEDLEEAKWLVSSRNISEQRILLNFATLFIYNETT